MNAEKRVGSSTESYFTASNAKIGVGGIDKFSTSVLKNIAVLLHTYYWNS